MSDPTYEFDAEISSEYDVNIAKALPGYQGLHNLVAASLAPHLTGSSKLLVIGAGTGADVLALAKLDQCHSILACEPEASMGSLGQKKTGPSLHNCAIDWHLGSLDSVDSDPFDAIVMTLVMHFIPDDGAKVAMWKQISKRLKPKGKMVFVNLSRSKDQQQHEAALRAWQEFNIINGIPKEEHQGFFNERLGKLPIVTEDRDRELWAEQGFSESFRFASTLLLRGSLLTKGSESQN